MTRTPSPISRPTATASDLAATRGDPLQASNAWAMGNIGLSSALRGDPELDSYDEEEAVDVAQLSWWHRGWGRVTRWVFGAGVFFAFINHWPGGR